MTASMPIAVVGMSCRFPGGAESPEAFWNLLQTGWSSWSKIPEERFNAKAFYHPDPDIRGTFNCAGAHFLNSDVRKFDAQFFGINPKEAATMDPQQRLQLECAYEALESGGQRVADLAGSDTAVFVSIFNRDYDRMLFRDPDNIPTYHMVGNGEAILSNRISHIFDLRGPSVTLDTGCSGGLVALHLACQSIRTGEAKQAIVGGTNLILSPDIMASLSQIRFFSPQGRCYSHDERAAGYGRGEGAAALLIKPLQDALRDGDPIRAVIRSTAINQDGRTQGMTLPSKDAQTALIRSTYQSASLDFSKTAYCEAHGTGTSVGDPIEAEAIATVFGGTCTSQEPVYLGSVKTNIGHLESASGLAGVIKTVLMLERGKIVPNHDFQKLNPKIRTSGWSLKIPTSLLDWPVNGVRQASVNTGSRLVSSFHQSAEIIPTQQHRSATTRVDLNTVCSNTDTHHRARHLLVVSGKSSQTCIAQRAALHRYLEDMGDEIPDDFLSTLSYTLCDRRSPFSWRWATSATTLLELKESLREDLPSPQRIRLQPKIGFVFTGQGAQWHAMARELINHNEVFTASLRRADECIKMSGASWSVIDELFRGAGESRVTAANLGQPLVTALQLAVVDLLTSWGITPSSVVGHSSGEIAAAYAAGMLSYESAMAVAYWRGEHASRVQSIDPQCSGSMMAVPISESEAQDHISQNSAWEGKIVIACSNSPSSVTLSGDSTAMKEIQNYFEKHEISARLLKVDTAYHSHHMRKIASQYLSSLKDMPPIATSRHTSFFSSVTATQLCCDDIKPSYWVQNLVSKVRFHEALQEMCQTLRSMDSEGKGLDVLIEVGPHAALATPIKQTLQTEELANAGIIYLPSFKRNEDAVLSIHHLASRLWSLGAEVNLGMLRPPGLPARPEPLIDLPSYQWDRSVEHWNEPRISKEYRNRPHPRHELLGSRSIDFDPIMPRWRNHLRLSEVPWLRDHVIESQVIYPAAGFLAMAVEAVRQIIIDRHGSEMVFHSLGFRDVSIERALILQDDSDGVEVWTTLQPLETNSKDSFATLYSFRVRSFDEQEELVNHCQGSLIVNSSLPQRRLNHSTANGDLTDRSTIHRRELGQEAVYDIFQRQNIQYRGNFATVKQISTDDRSAIAVVESPAVLDIANLGLISKADRLQIRAQVCGSFATDGSFEAWSGAESVERCPLITGKGIHITGTPSLEYDDTAKRPHVYCNELIPDVDLLEPWAIQEICCAEVSEPQKSVKEELEAFETLSLFFVQRASHELGHVSSLAIDAEQLRHLWNWMETFLEQNAKSKHPNHASWNDAEVKQLVRKVQGFGDEGKMLVRMGYNLPAILSGAAQPLPLMLEDDLLSSFYHNDSLSRCYIQMGKFLQLQGLKNPTMAILEIGAGTGGTTVSVLEALSRPRAEDGFMFKSYDFTDISSGFFDKAQSLLERWKGSVNYKRLDIEKRPSIQGFAPGSYDMVIASNVLHATRDIENTIGNVRELLKPGGKFVLLEITKLQAHLNVSFGGLPGWWAGVLDNRVSSPLMTQDRWAMTLRRNRFSAFNVCLSDYEGETRRTEVLVSTAVLGEQENLSNSRGMVYSMSCQGIFVTFQLRYRMKADPDKSASVEPETPSATPGLTVCVNKANDRALTIARGLEGTFEALDLVDVDGICEGYDLHGKLCLFLGDMTGELLMSWPYPRIKELLQTMSSAARTLWVTQERTKSGIRLADGFITGLTRSWNLQKSHSAICTLDLSESSPISQHVSVITTILQSFSRVSASPAEMEYVEKEGQTMISRLLVDPIATNDMLIKFETKSLNATNFQQGTHPLEIKDLSKRSETELVFASGSTASEPLGKDEIEILPQYISLRARNNDHLFDRCDGVAGAVRECSGTVRRVGSVHESPFKVGDRVCATGSDPASNHFRVSADMAHLIPSRLSYEEALSIPIILVTAFYCLNQAAKAQKGDSVLVYQAAQTFGQAVVALAQFMELDIYAEVDQESDLTLLVERFGIPLAHIFLGSKTDNGEATRMTDTHQKFDVVVGCSNQNSMQQALNCIACFGTIVCLGSIPESTSLCQSEQRKIHCTVSVVNPDLLYHHKTALFQRLSAEVMNLVREADSKGQKLFGSLNEDRCFLKTGCNANVKEQEKPHMACPHHDATYIIVGSNSVLEDMVCNWLKNSGIGTARLLSVSASISLEKTIEGIKSKGHVLGGIFHVDFVGLDPSDTDGEQLDTLSVSQIRSNTSLQNLLSTLKDEQLDFLVLISSVQSLTGAMDVEHVIRSSQRSSLIARSSGRGYPVLALDVGMIAYSGHDSVTENYPSTSSGDFQSLLCALLDSAFDSMPRKGIMTNMIVDINLENVTEGKWSVSSDPRFLHTGSQKSTSQSIPKDEPRSLEQELQSCNDLESSTALLCKALAKRLGKLLACSSEDFKPSSSIATFGIDSLVAAELRAWIFQSLGSPIKIEEILGRDSIVEIARKIAQRSSLVKKNLLEPAKGSSNGVVEHAQVPNGTNEHALENGIQHSGNEAKHTLFYQDALPKMPVPSLRTTLEEYMLSIRPLLTDAEYALSKKRVEDFGTKGGWGEILQERLEARSKDPEIENWLYEYWVTHYYLNPRKPIAPATNFFMAHEDTVVKHSMAKRASIITRAVIDFKNHWDKGTLEPAMLHDAPICMQSYHWLFNTCRIPKVGGDQSTKAQTSNHITVIWRNTFYRLEAEQHGRTLSIRELESQFWHITEENSATAEPGLGLLTTEDRDLWARARTQIMDLDEANAASIDSIESSAFVICLDEELPRTSEERAHQFWHGNGSNRYSDKPLQFIVTPINSGFNGEHSRLDGSPTIRLNKHVNKHLLEFADDESSKWEINGKNGLSLPKKLPIHLSRDMLATIDGARSRFNRAVADCQLEIVYYHGFGETFLRKMGCHPSTTLQMVFQLASYRFYGKPIPSFEPVGNFRFKQGRYDAVRSLSNETTSFCASMTHQKGSSASTTKPEEQMRLLRTAMNAHIKRVRNLSYGGSVDNHMFGLWMSLREDEEAPEIFTDPIFRYSTDWFFSTSYMPADEMEYGFGPDVNDGWSVQYPIWPDK
ncbi:MAG: hypothetical protein Q9182_001656 [Xanthomendoza sp. 2 TL-2023]